MTPQCRVLVRQNDYDEVIVLSTEEEDEAVRSGRNRRLCLPVISFRSGDPAGCCRWPAHRGDHLKPAVW
jgi:hypothetical protein